MDSLCFAFWHGKTALNTELFRISDVIIWFSLSEEISFASSPPPSSIQSCRLPGHHAPLAKYVSCKEAFGRANLVSVVAERVTKLIFKPSSCIATKIGVTERRKIGDAKQVAKSCLFSAIALKVTTENF